MKKKDSDKYLDGIREKIKGKLSHQRAMHTLRVEETAVALAKQYRVDTYKVAQAALLHDIAKEIPRKKQKKLLENYGVKKTKSMKKNPALIHAVLGEEIARNKYQVLSPHVLQAIRYHTTGRPRMSPIEQIIYISDFIEPGRKQVAGLTMARDLAYNQGLEEALYYILKITVDYLKQKEKKIDPMTEKAYIYYHKKRKKKELTND